MLTLYHYPFSPACRFVRLILAEYGVRHELVLERHWERRKQLLAMNPGGFLPVAVENDGPPIVGAGPILEYLDETRGYAQGEKRLMPDHPDRRAETRRLVEWFLQKFEDEVIGHLVHERIYKLDMPTALGGGAPESAVLRVARANMRHHMRYIEYLTGTRNWLAGDHITFADLAAAAELSCADYLGEVPWAENDHAKTWYARVKSRPSFRPLLGETVRGMPPVPSYQDLDF
ncbi:glutathione S-transferase family protein [Segnochrobactrum spirostomi]|uniref:Glutathione S-transferase family protein n=1 Tax=Segnochrobactrum spirostomi TaxID=2608987 RepID=A0A6A7Y3H9_9HYPH|nr:glutathione S-transferase family protein [Segnochrobactrum spirostomi]MQT13316.1 glutathione S-transferase family protein [Segnochrobactrum spirostomi]